MVEIERIQTGIPGLDPLIGGGLIKKSTTLIAGGPGTGKTVAVLQMTNNFLKQGKKGFFLSLESDTDKIFQYADTIGLDLKKYATERQLIVAAPRSEKIYVENIVDDIVSISSTLDFIIIDSMTKLLEIASFLVKEKEMKDEEEIEVIKSERELTRQDYWSLIFVGESEDSGQKITVEGVAEYEADCVIFLKKDETTGKRKLIVEKMRGTNIDIVPKNLTFTPNGIKVG